jgi:hypothetical protein
MNSSKRVLVQCAFRLPTRPLPRCTSANSITNNRAYFSRRYHTSHHQAADFTHTTLPPYARRHRSHRQRQLHPCNTLVDALYTIYGTMTMSASSNTSSAKRKRSSPKFYAVRVGRKPGIYQSWPDCEAQVKGVPSVCEWQVRHIQLRLMHYQSRAFPRAQKPRRFARTRPPRQQQQQSARARPANSMQSPLATFQESIRIMLAYRLKSEIALEQSMQVSLRAKKLRPL